MNKYNVCVIGIEKPFLIYADKFKIEDNLYKFILMDQLKNKEVIVGIFPVDKTAIEKIQ